MAEPTLALTFEDLIIRVAEYLAVASYAGGSAAIPTDAHNLEKCKRYVNDGFRRFYTSKPQWNWTDRTFSLTFTTDTDSPDIVDGDIARYYMPDGFYGQIMGTFTYEQNSGYIDIEQVPEQLIRSMYASTIVQGYPTKYAIRPLHEDNKRRWEAYFWPQPSQGLTITGRCRIYPNKLVELTDTPSCGFEFDDALIAACKAEAELDSKQASGPMMAHWAEALVRAYAIDQRSAPARLGDYGGAEMSEIRSYTGVDTYTSKDGTVTTFTT